MMLTAEEKNLLKRQVEEIEKGTSGEIVPLVVERSSPDGSLPDWLICLIFLLGLGAIYIYELVSIFPVPIFTVLNGLGCLVLAVAIATSFSRVRSLFIFKEARARYVHQRAMLEFMNEGLMNTRDRSGVLVFVSKFERRIQILADKGISEKVTNAEWKAISDQAALLLREGKVKSALSEALSKIGPLLQSHFPRKDDDTNELSDEVKEIP